MDKYRGKNTHIVFTHNKYKLQESEYLSLTRTNLYAKPIPQHL